MTDIAEIFARHPDETTDADITEIIKVFRERRKQFDIGNLMAGKTKPPTGKALEAVKATGKLDLKKLGL